MEGEPGPQGLALVTTGSFVLSLQSPDYLEATMLPREPSWLHGERRGERQRHTQLAPNPAGHPVEAQTSQGTGQVPHGTHRRRRRWHQTAICSTAVTGPIPSLSPTFGASPAAPHQLHLLPRPPRAFSVTQELANSPTTGQRAGPALGFAAACGEEFLQL